MTSSLGIRASALPAWRELHDALMALPRPTVCASDPESFTDPDPDDLAYTTALCTGCRVFALCDAFATANKESAGIWAGRDRTPTRGRPAAQPKGLSA